MLIAIAPKLSRYCDPLQFIMRPLDGLGEEFVDQVIGLVC